MSPLAWEWLGRQPYAEVLERQRRYRLAVIERGAPEVIWLLEHDPVITTGRRPVPDLPSPSVLAARGIELARTERGGLATYHCPGQLVAYAIVDCWTRGMGARGAVYALEQAVIDWLATLNLAATRRNGWPGVWIGDHKICAIGMHFKQGISMHGLALNISNSLDGFSLITPCGIQDAGVTRLLDHVANDLTPQRAAKLLAPHIVHNLDHPSCTSRRRSLRSS